MGTSIRSRVPGVPQSSHQPVAVEVSDMDINFFKVLQWHKKFMISIRYALSIRCLCHQHLS